MCASCAHRLLKTLLLGLLLLGLLLRLRLNVVRALGLVGAVVVGWSRHHLVLAGRRLVVNALSGGLWRRVVDARLLSALASVLRLAVAAGESGLSPAVVGVVLALLPLRPLRRAVFLALVEADVAGLVLEPALAAGFASALPVEVVGAVGRVAVVGALEVFGVLVEAARLRGSFVEGGAPLGTALLVLSVRF